MHGADTGGPPRADAAAPVIAVVGPTASGKSDLAVRIASALGGEVVNADSMQLYRGMDIGTAKLPPPERCGVPHHLLDVWDVGTAASVAEYQRLAREIVEALRAAGRAPVLAGGSGLYVRAVLDDLRFPGTDPAVRARLAAEWAEQGAAVMHRRLAEVDPVAAASILPGNGRRVVRALEVVELTGEPFTATLPGPDPVYRPEARIGLAVPRDMLDRRIAERVDRMWEAGLLAEVRRLADQDGLRDGVTASRALGYQQVLAFLDGAISEAEAKAQTVQATRAFARRQDKWFRRDPRVVWLPYDAADLLDRALEVVAQAS
jgi:tRNA dimethylallyltransferase